MYDGDREELDQDDASENEVYSDEEFVIPEISDIPDLDLDAADDSTTPKDTEMI